MKRFFIALLLVILLLPGVVDAQGGGELPFDAPVEATLRADGTHTYTFRSEGTDAITVRMMSDVLDPVLVLYDPAGNLLAFNDDSAQGETDAALMEVRLPMPGVYTLVARSYGNRGAGAYTLRAISRRAETLDGSAPLPLGETIDAELFTVGQTDRWLFDGQAGQVISVRMDAGRGTRLDPLLELLAADGTVLAYSDDDGGDKNSLINGFELPVDGQYVVVARAWGNATAGAYTLTLAEGVLAADQAVTAPYAPAGPSAEGVTAATAARNEAGLIVVEDEISGVLAQGAADVWTLELAEAQVLNVTLVAVEGVFDPLLVLEDEAGVVLAENDDSGVSLDSALRGVSLAAGRYQVVVRSYADEGQGAYVLAVRAVDPSAVNTGPVLLDVPVRAALMPGMEDQWMLDAEAGDVVTVAVYAGANAFDAVLRVYGPDGREVTADDDSGPYYNPMLIGWTVPETGTYTLGVSGYDPAAAGDYELVVVPLAAFLVPEAWQQGELSFDTPLDATFEDGTAHMWTFTVPEDQDLALHSEGGVVIELRGADGSGVPVFEQGERMRLQHGAVYDLFVYGPVGRSYRLELQPLDPPAVNTGTIAAGVTHRAILAAGAVDRWTFEGSAGDLVSIGLYAQGGVFDPVLHVEDANGVQSASDDDSGLLRNSLIKGWRVPVDGTYTLLVSAFRSSGSGAYDIMMQAGDVLIFPEHWLQGTIDDAAPVQGLLDAGDPAHVWALAGTGGQAVTLTYGGSLTVEIVSEDGDSEGVAASGTPVILNRSGTFYVVVSRVADAPLDEILDYELTLILE